jgi:hypothetical protein
MIFWIINKIITAYIFSTSIFLLIILFNKPSRKRSNIFLHKSNLIIIVVLLFNVIAEGVEAVKCKNAAIKNVVDNAQDGSMNYSQHCISIFVFTLLFAFLFQVLFFFHKFRIKIFLTIISIFLLGVYNNYEKVVVFITGIFRDYLPSSWATFYQTEGSIWSFALAIAYFIICWSNKPRNLSSK